jgi:hypothetical protein
MRRLAGRLLVVIESLADGHENRRRDKLVKGSRSRFLSSRVSRENSSHVMRRVSTAVLVLVCLHPFLLISSHVHCVFGTLIKQDTNHEKANFCPEERWWFASKIATSGKDC